jgi:hypothetical protein
VQRERRRGPNNFLLFPWSFSLTKGRAEIYRLEKLVIELEFGGGGKKKRNKGGNGGILGCVMNTVEGGFPPPTRPPKNPATSKCSSIRNVKFLPPPSQRHQFYCCLGNVSRVIELWRWSHGKSLMANVTWNIHLHTHTHTHIYIYRFIINGFAGGEIQTVFLPLYSFNSENFIVLSFVTFR